MSIFSKISKFFKTLFCGGKKETPLLPEYSNFLWNLKTFEDMRLGGLNPDTVSSIKKSLTWSLKKVDPDLIITDKPSKFVRDTHNYVSLATYFWPNPDTEGGLPWIEKDGQRNPECDNYDLPKLQKLAESLRHLVMSYALDPQDEKYDTFTNLVYNWFINQDTRMYPNFRYCQIGPGTNSNEGINSFESYFLLEVFEAIAYMNSLKPLPVLFLPSLKRWVADLVEFLETSPQGKFENNIANNHSIMYDTGLIFFKLWADRKLDTDTVSRLYKRIDTQIASNGSQPEELKRNQGFKYSVYNLDHMVDAIKIIEAAGATVPEHIYTKVTKAFSFLYLFQTKEGFNTKYQEIGNWNACWDYYLRTAARVGIQDYDFYKNINFLFL